MENLNIDNLSPYAINDVLDVLDMKLLLAKKCLKICEECGDPEETLARYRDTAIIYENFINQITKNG